MHFESKISSSFLSKDPQNIHMSEYIENTISRQEDILLFYFSYNGNKRGLLVNTMAYTKMQLGLGIREWACMNVRVKIPVCDFSTSKGG